MLRIRALGYVKKIKNWFLTDSRQVEETSLRRIGGSGLGIDFIQAYY